MSTNVSILRLQDAWRECERNLYYLCAELASLNSILPMQLLPMTAKRFKHLINAQVQALDQFILQFYKTARCYGWPFIFGYFAVPTGTV